MSVKFDKLDLMILAELREDCKQSARQLAKKLGTHPNTIMQRIKALENEEIVKKYSARINFSAIGYDLHTIIMIKVDKRAREKWDVLGELRRIPALVAGYTITGAYDVLVIARNKDRKDLTKLLKHINNRPYVMESNTILVLEPFKYSAEFNPLVEWLLPQSKKRR